MSSTMNMNIGGGIWLAIIITFFICLSMTRCTDRTESRPNKDFDGQVHKVICISETGDTVKVWQTKDKPGYINSQGIICVYGFRDLETGKPVEVRTRTGTVVWQ